MMNSESMTGKTVTLIIHGTSASEESWWRLGEGNQKTFADSLEAALKKRGLPGTVWAPAQEEGFSYEHFSWSGENRHRARHEGGEKLAKSINELANKVKANKEQPLTVNFVAHSHGGNVVLEAIRHLNKTVSVGRCVMLGTPLISFIPSFRLWRLFIGTSLFSFPAVMLLSLFLYPTFFFCAYLEFASCQEDTLPNPIVFLGSWLFIGLFLTLLSGWAFAILAWIGDVAWILVLKLSLLPFYRRTGQTYGPWPADLAKRLGTEPGTETQKQIVLYTSPLDEAELILKLGADPNQLYRHYCAGIRNEFFRATHNLILYPVIELFFFKAFEIVLERFLLGFSWWRVLILDYEILVPQKRGAYPNRLFKTVNLRDNDLSLDDSNKVRKSEMATTNEVSGASSPSTCLTALQRAVSDMKAQITDLRHGRYYRSDTVINRVADSLTGRVG